VRRGLAAVALCGALAAPASAHPGHSAPTVSISVYAYNPDTINVIEGDVVQWNWDGPDTGHSVTSDAGSGETFDSGVKDAVGSTFTYYFGKAGTYAYHCKRHDSMHGTVVVAAGAAVDRKPPRLSRVRARVKKRMAVVRFKISEGASVTALVRRPGKKKVLERSFRFVRAGAARTQVRLPGRGRFAVSLVAEDQTGNKGRAAVRVRR
jgi:plastocyanin